MAEMDKLLALTDEDEFSNTVETVYGSSAARRSTRTSCDLAGDFSFAVTALVTTDISCAVFSFFSASLKPKSVMCCSRS